MYHHVMKQVASVARAHGVDIPDSEAVMYVGKNNARMTTVRLHKTSMLQDVLANRPTEVDFLAGYIVCNQVRSGLC